MNCDLVVLYSGGADSTLLLNLARSAGRQPLALMIDYNQLHIDELSHAKNYTEKNKYENMTIKIDGYNVNSALTGNGEKGIYDGMKKALTNPEYFEKYQENLKDYQMPFNLENSVYSICKIIDNL